MKKESEEKKIKELFQRLKREDERLAPPFADSWAAARSRLETRGQAFRGQPSNWPRWFFAAVAAILIAFGFIVYRAIQNEPQKPGGVITEKAPPPQPSVKPDGRAANGAVEPKPPSVPRAPRPRRRDWRRLDDPFIIEQLNELFIIEGIPTYAKRDEYATDFLPLSYGGVQKPIESGGVIRLQMPGSALIAFGLPVNVERADAPITADLLVGEDGIARAIRFVRREE